MTISDIRDLMTTGKFHHATHRNIGRRCFEGLYVYAIDDNNFNGYMLVGQVWADAPEFTSALNLTRGYSVDSYGQG